MTNAVPNKIQCDYSEYSMIWIPNGNIQSENEQNKREPIVIMRLTNEWNTLTTCECWACVCAHNASWEFIYNILNEFIELYTAYA